MKDAIFYTFSTIPQVLAGAIALIGMFAIYKIQEIKLELLGTAQNFLDKVKNEDNVSSTFLNQTLIGRQYSVLPEAFSKVIDSVKELNEESIEKQRVHYSKDLRDKSGISGIEEMERTSALAQEVEFTGGYVDLITDLILRKEAYEELHPRISKIICATIFSTIYTAIIILASIIIIPYASEISQWCRINLFFIISFILVGINLALLIRIIKIAL